jgi:hypothetical protein
LVTNKPIYHSELQPILERSNRFCIGIELGNAQNGTVDLGRFSLDNMESVTLYNGQK